MSGRRILFFNTQAGPHRDLKASLLHCDALERVAGEVKVSVQVEKVSERGQVRRRGEGH